MTTWLSITVVAGLAALALGLALSFVRLVRGPTLADRVLALDTMAVTGVGLMAIAAIAFDATVFLDIALILVVAGFVATAAFARMVEQGALRPRGGDGP